MPIEHFVRAEDHLLVVAHVGTIGDDEFLSFYKGLYGSEGFDRTLTHLIDLRRANSSPRSSDVLRELADYMHRTFEETSAAPRVAVVAPEALTYGLARMYDSFSAGIPKSSTEGIPSSQHSRDSLTISSTDNWNTPGMAPISFLTPSPWTTKRG